MAHQYRDAVGPWSAYLGVLQCTGHSAPQAIELSERFRHEGHDFTLHARPVGWGLTPERLTLLGSRQPLRLNAFLDPCEQIRLLLNQSRSYSSGKMEHLLVSALAGV